MADARLRRLGHWIAGEECHTGGDQVGVALHDPASEKAVAVVEYADEPTVRKAVDAASGVGLDWANWTASRRSKLFFNIRDALREATDELSAIITQEHGKTLGDAQGEVERAIEVVETCCTPGQLAEGRLSPNVSQDIDVYASRYPLGVVVGISPYNFPIMVPAWMWAPALATGNTFVLKPSERDPSASNLVARLLKEAGVPDGVFNVVHGDSAAASALIAERRVAAVSFVGSTNVAKQVYRQATSLGKRCQALGGAKNHLVVMEDADLEAAADGAVSAAFGSAGQRCMAVSVVVAMESIADELIRLVSQRVAKLSVGPGCDAATDMGPLISSEHRQRVSRYLEAAPTEGATIAIDGRAELPERGYFLKPSLIDHVRPGMSCYEDEIFGPILAVVRAKDYQEAIAVVNGHRYGNGASVFTSSGATARRFQRDAEAGMIGVNIPIPVPVASHSFGGWKDSLFGDFGVYGQSGFDFYTRLKTVTSRWSPAPSAPSKPELSFPSSGDSGRTPRTPG